MILSYRKVIFFLLILLTLPFTTACSKEENIYKDISSNTLSKDNFYKSLNGNYIYIGNESFNDMGIIYYFKDNEIIILNDNYEERIYLIESIESSSSKIVYTLRDYISDCKGNETNKLIIHKSKGDKIYIEYPNFIKISRELDILNKNECINYIIKNPKGFSYKNIERSIIGIDKIDLEKNLR